MKITTVHWVRHGEIHNPRKILPGRLPSFYLSKAGKKQAKMAADYLKRKSISVIYTSPLERCIETAEILRKLVKCNLQQISDLNEVKTPREGESLDKLEKDNFNLYKKMYIEQGGETMEEVYTRISRVLTRILQKYKGQNVVCVTHGDLIVFLKLKLLWGKLDFKFSRGPYYPTLASIQSFSFLKHHLIQNIEVKFLNL